MNVNDIGATTKPVSEFEKLLNEFAESLARQNEVISRIEGRVTTIMSFAEIKGSDAEKELAKGGLIGEFQSKIQVVKLNNRILEAIDSLLEKTIG